MDCHKLLYTDQESRCLAKERELRPPSPSMNLVQHTLHAFKKATLFGEGNVISNNVISNKLFKCIVSAL